MKNHTEHNAISNAAQIGFELAKRGTVASAFVMLEQIQEAATSLAHIESGPAFRWNEGASTDWETACARLAERIEAGKPCTVSACRRASIA